MASTQAQAKPQYPAHEAIVECVRAAATLPFAQVWIVELLVVAVMVALILLVSMEVIHEPPLIRLFSGIGFFWVAIMFGMTLTDDLAR